MPMINIFNSNYEEVGSLQRNLVLNTLGKIKLRFGRKYIDLIDDKGNLNVQIPKILQQKKSIEDITSDGLYIVDGSLYAYYAGQLIQVTGVEGAYIEYGTEQMLTAEQMLQAQKNIGLAFSSISEAQKHIEQGLVIIDGKMYYINGKDVQEWPLTEPLKSINSISSEPTTDKSGLLWKDGNWQYVTLVTQEDFNSYKNSILKEKSEESSGEEEEDENTENSGVFDPIQYSTAYTIKSWTTNVSGESIDNVTFTTVPNSKMQEGDVAILSVNGAYCQIQTETNDGIPTYTAIPETHKSVHTYLVDAEDFLSNEEIDNYAKGVNDDDGVLYPDARWSRSGDYIKITRTENEVSEDVLTFNLVLHGQNLYFTDASGSNVSYTLKEAYYEGQKVPVIGIGGKNFALIGGANTFVGKHLYIKAESSKSEKFKIDYNGAEIALEENTPSPFSIVPHTVLGDLDNTDGYYNGSSFRTYTDRESSQGLYSDQAVLNGPEFRGKWPIEENFAVSDFPRYSSNLNKELVDKYLDISEQDGKRILSQEGSDVIVPTINWISHPLIAGYKYSKDDKKIFFYNLKGEEIGEGIDTTDFIVDGMVDNVQVSGSNIEITFNTFAHDVYGKQTIYIPISQIFDASKYYTKGEVDSLIASIDTGDEGGGSSGGGGSSVDLSGYLTTSEASSTYATKTSIPTKTSQLFNDSGYITGTIPTKLSQLENDVGFITEVSSGSGSTTDSLPSGAIIMWSGLVVPQGWAICDGENGTPNLIGKFIKATYMPGNTGGANEVTLTNDNLPEHKHTFYNYLTQVHGNTEINDGTMTINGETVTVGKVGKSDNPTRRADTANSSFSDIPYIKHDTLNAGSALPKAIKIEPEYYTLIFIMKL